jgi:hypothetical protein
MVNIWLTLIFYLFLVPIALLQFLLRSENQLKLKNTEQSLFKETQRDFSENSFKKMW